MHKKLTYIIIIVIGFTSCRPGYMRCPKNRRCDVTPTMNKNIIMTTHIHSSTKEQLCLNF